VGVYTAQFLTKTENLLWVLSISVFWVWGHLYADKTISSKWNCLSGKWTKTL